MSDKASDIELLKFSWDWCKHVCTLSTGSILLIVTFLEKLSKQPTWKPLVAVALALFVIAILAATALQLVHLYHGRYEEEGDSKVSMVAGGVTILAFFLGTLSLAIFGVVNLL